MINCISNLAGSREPAHASANVERGQGEGDILPLSPDNHDSPAHERLIDAERGNPFLHDLADKPSARILIETEVGGVAALFIFQPFHLSEVTDA